jgi:hypothetical protein
LDLGPTGHDLLYQDRADGVGDDAKGERYKEPVALAA